MAFKVGNVAFIGRPNVGKSTLLNTLVNHKVAIVSPKPQTTQSQITAYLEDERGQIFFKDTPGYFASQKKAQAFNRIIAGTAKEANVVVYLVDHTRKWGREEDSVREIITKLHNPIILVINKVDIQKPSYKEEYLEKLESSVTEIVEISALKDKGVKTLVESIFSRLPEGERNATVDYFVSPLLSLTSTEYLEELVREKILLLTRQEIPYETTVSITSVKSSEERGTLKVEGIIKVARKQHKPILIGAKGKKIAEITQAVTKELRLATGKKVFVRLQVVIAK